MPVIFNPTPSALTGETEGTVGTEEKEATVEANEEVVAVVAAKELWSVADPCLIHSGITADGLGTKALAWVLVLVLRVP